MATHDSHIDKTYIETLVSERVSESKTIEFKQSLPTTSDRDRSNFLASVCSFANTQGGDLIYGIVEERDADGKSTGRPEIATGLQGINVDHEKLRLEGMVARGIQRRVQGIRIEPVDGFPDGPVIVIRIPKSWNGPHAVTISEVPRFFGRTNSGRNPFDVEEIRSAILAADSIPQQIRSFRNDRLSLIEVGDEPMPLVDRPAVVFHVVPLAALGNDLLVSMDELLERREEFPPLRAGGWNHRINVDGFLNYTRDLSASPATAYTLVFRSGQIEAVEQSMLTEHREDGRIISSGAFQESLLEACPSYLHGLESLGVPPPFVLMATLLDAKGYRLKIDPALEMRNPLEKQGAVDRERLYLPDVTVESSRENPATYLRPIFDALWNACGYPRCLTYDREGKYQSW